MLAAVALGKNPRTFGGVNLVRRLRAKVASNGRIGSFLELDLLGVLAFRAAGARLPHRSVAYIRAHQLSSGGFSYAAGAGPDSNDTAAAVMALRAASVPCGWKVITRSYDYLHGLQRSDHGYALTSSAGSDSQSTSWAVQARIKCGLTNGGALSYLAARKRPNGSYNYRAGVDADAGLGDVAGAAGRERAGLSDPVTDGQISRSARRRRRPRSRSSAAAGPPASWSRRRARPAWR